jgi:hypothetical protein
MVFALVGCKAPKESGGAEARASLKPIGEVNIKTTLGPEDAARTIEPKEASEALYWTTVRSGGSADARLSYETIASFKAFEQRFGGRAEELGERFDETAFRKMFVVAVSLTVNTGGYSVGVNKASIADGEAVIDLKLTAPSKGTVVTQAFETHTVLISFDQALYSEGLNITVTVNGQQYSVGDTE